MSVCLGSRARTRIIIMYRVQVRTDTGILDGLWISTFDAHAVK